MRSDITSGPEEVRSSYDSSMEASPQPGTSRDQDHLPSIPQALDVVYRDLMEQIGGTQSWGRVAAFCLRLLTLASFVLALLLVLDQPAWNNIVLLGHSTAALLGWLGHFLLLEFRTHQSLHALRRRSQLHIVTTACLLLIAVLKAIFAALPLETSQSEERLHGKEAVIHFLLTILSTLEAVFGAAATHAAVQLHKVLKLYGDSGLLEPLGHRAASEEPDLEFAHPESVEASPLLQTTERAPYWRLATGPLLKGELRQFYILRWGLKASSLSGIVLGALVLGRLPHEPLPPSAHGVEGLPIVSIAGSVLCFVFATFAWTTGGAVALGRRLYLYEYLTMALSIFNFLPTVCIIWQPTAVLYEYGTEGSLWLSVLLSLASLISTELSIALFVVCKSGHRLVEAGLKQPISWQTDSQEPSSSTLTI